MDGTAPATLHLRLPRAQLVIWPDLPRSMCLWGVLRRWIANLGRTRPEMAPGCPERIHPEFLRYVWTWNRDVRPRVLEGLCTQAPETPVLVLRSHGEMDAFLREIEKPTA